MIVSILKYIVENQLDGDYTFYHGDDGLNNFASSEANYPAVFLDHPMSYNYGMYQGGLITDKPKPTLIIVDKQDQLDSDNQMSDVSSICLASKQAGAKIVSMLQEHEAVMSVVSAKSDEVTNLFDAGLSGHIFTIQVELNPGYTFC